MTVQEFKQMIGGKNAVIMISQVDGNNHFGHIYNKNKEINCDLVTGLALYKQFYNLPEGGEARRWVPKDASVTDHEAALMNDHFEKVHKRELGDEPVKIKSHKK